MNKKRSFLYKMFTLFILSAGGFIFVLYKIDPRDGGTGIGVLLVALFLSVVSLFAFLNYSLLRKSSNNERHFSATRGSVRRGILLGFYIIGVLGLSAIELLTWWDALLLALSLILFELYFISGKESTS